MSVAEPGRFGRGGRLAVAVALTLVLAILAVYVFRSKPGQVSGLSSRCLGTLTPYLTGWASSRSR